MNDHPPLSSSAIEPPVRPGNWRSALADLVAARTELVQLELKQAASSTIKRAVFFAAAGILVLLAWIILVAGIIGAIADKGNFPWYWVTLIAGAIHLLLALIFVSIAKRPGAATFEITRSEFKKDREWLQKFQSPKKSND